MRKRMAAFIGEIGREFQLEFLRCLKQVGEERDYDIFVFSNFGSYVASTLLFDAGERDIIQLPEFTAFEGVISLPDTFDLDGMESLLIKRIKNTSDCPIVSVRNGSRQTYRVLFDDYTATYEMTKHFIDDHGYKKICYMSGPHTADDAVERLRGFKAAMKDSGLPLNSKLVYEGDYWNFASKQAVDYFLETYDGKPEAIICGNDYMAIGVCDELKKRGFKIPDDIAVCGFDEAFEGKGYQPSLSTIKLPTLEMANKAFDIVEGLRKGENFEKDTYITGKIRCKRSCGCNIEHSEFDMSIISNKLIENYINIRTAGFISSDIQNCITEKEKLDSLGKYFSNVKSERGYLCLCTDNVSNDSPYSNTMLLRKIFTTNGSHDYNPAVGGEFNRKYILPEAVYSSATPSCFVVHPVHHKNTTYGYLVNEIGDADLSWFIVSFISGLCTAYDDLRLQEQFGDFTEIKRQNLLDPLTGINNRRGFEQKLSKVLAEHKLGKSVITFISADMDNLKYINDNFGHQEGDFALQTVTEVLKGCVGDNDVFARVGGDEFYIILTSPNPILHESFKSVVEATLAKKCQDLGKQYDIHVSIGCCMSHKENITDATECIRIADMRMYDAKKEYKNSL